MSETANSFDRAKDERELSDRYFCWPPARHTPRPIGSPLYEMMAPRHQVIDRYLTENPELGALSIVTLRLGHALPALRICGRKWRSSAAPNWRQ